MHILPSFASLFGSPLQEPVRVVVFLLWSACDALLPRPWPILDIMWVESHLSGKVFVNNVWEEVMRGQVSLLWVAQGQ